MSCCCSSCCSSSYVHWQIPSTATCLLTGIQRLQEGETLESVCPIAYPNGDCISDVYHPPENYRREAIAVKAGQCDNLYPVPVEGPENKCYVCHECVSACIPGDIAGCIPTPDPCTEDKPYNCRKPTTAVWAAAPCLSAVKAQCEFCIGNPEPDAEEDPEGAALWLASCGVQLGVCHSAPASYCFEGDGPFGCGYYSVYSENSPFAVEDCPDCDDKGYPCGGGGACTTPGSIQCPIPCSAGPDTCGNYYTGCASECVGGITTFCCPETSPNNCEGVPFECLFCL